MGSIAPEVEVGSPRLQPDGTLLVTWSAVPVGVGRWRLDGHSLNATACLAPAPPLLPAALLHPLPSQPGMQVNTVVDRQGPVRYILRWETLPRNRDRPRATAPEPTELRLYTVPDTGGELLHQVGS